MRLWSDIMEAPAPPRSEDRPRARRGKRGMAARRRKATRTIKVRRIG